MLCGYSKDCASALRGSDARTSFAECDPFCAGTARIALPLSVVSSARVFVTKCDHGGSCVRHVGDIFVSSTDNFNVTDVKEQCVCNISALDHMKMLRNSAFVDDTRHFDNEINLACSEGLEGLKVDNILPQ